MYILGKKICFNNILCVFLAFFILSSSQLWSISKERSSHKKEQKEQENKSDQNKTTELHKYTVEAILPIVDFKAPTLFFFIISLPDSIGCYSDKLYIDKILQSSIFKKLFTCIIAANAP